MSTPVQNLPAPQAGQPIDDPTIRDVLKEMDAEVAAATAANRPHQPMHMMQMMPPQMMQQHQHPMMMSAPSQGFQSEIAKRALIAAAIATILFHPMITTMLENRLPILSSSDLYMAAARVILLAAVFYMLMWKLDM